jgi:hypothetical protein
VVVDWRVVVVGETVVEEVVPSDVCEGEHAASDSSNTRAWTGRQERRAMRQIRE